MKKERVIMHLDLDAFYAACEQNRKPSLKDKPVIVGADPKEGKGRGVVSTASYEARKYGIHSGMPISWAYRKCPEAVFLPVDMAYYVSVSKKVMNLLKEKADKFEQSSIDEASLDVSNLGFKGGEKLAKKIKEELKKKENLTCSIGIAPNMLVAKIASDFKKPDGLTIVKASKVKNFLFPLSVRKLLGVGPKTEEALNKLGIKTISQLAKADAGKLRRHFGKWGEMMSKSAKGIDEREVGFEGPIKSIGRQATFGKDISDKEKILKSLDGLVKEVLDDARESNAKFKTIVVKVRYEDFSTHTSQKKFKGSLSVDEARAWANELLKPFLRDKRKVRLIGFSVRDLKIEEKSNSH